MKDERGAPRTSEACGGVRMEAPAGAPLSRSSRWLRRHLRRSAAAAGTGGLALPLMAIGAAGQTEGMVSAAGIDGVVGVAVGADGAATLTLANGQSVLVAAGQVQIVAGEVLITVAAAESVAAAVAVAGAGGAGSLAAIGLGGAGLIGASGNDGAREPGVAIAIDRTGGGVLNAVDLAGPMVVTGLVRGMGEGSAVEVDLLGGDGASVLGAPLPAVLTGERWTASIEAGVLAGLADGSYGLLARARDAEGQELAVTTRPLRLDQTPPEIAITLPVAGDDVIGIAEQAAGITVTGTTTGAEPGQTVTVTLNGAVAGSGTTAANGSWSVSIPAAALAALADDATVTLAASVSDAAGNPATPALATLLTDFTAPEIAIDVIAGDDVLTLATLAGDLILTGTTTGAEDRQTVTVGFAGASYTGTVLAGGWSVTVPQAALLALESGAALSVTASVADAAGNPALPASRSVTTDFAVPAVAIGPVAGDDVVNAAEAAAGTLLISGTTANVGAGQTVEITVAGPGGPLLTTAVTGPGGDWSASIAAPETDGASFTVTAVASNAEGIPTAPATRNFVTDLSPPVLSIDALPGGFLNAAQLEAGFAVSGTVAGNDGRAVEVALGGVTVAATLDGAGGWSAAFGPGVLAGLPDGPATLTASTADAAGNPADVTAPPVTVDQTPPDLVLDPLPFGEVLNLDGRDAGFTVSGSASDNGSATAVEGAQVLVRLVLPSGVSELAATVTGGSWSAAFSPAQYGTPELAEGSARIELRLTDAAGNIAETSQSFAVDFVAPELTIDPPAFGGFLGVEAAAGAVEITGSVSGHDDQPVRVTMGGIEAVADVAADGSWSAVFAPGALSALAEGPATLTASTADAAGNGVEALSDGFTVDFTPPVLRILSLGTEGLADLSAAAGVTISGDVDDPAVGSVVVSLRGIDYAAPVAGDGSWSVTIPAAALDGVVPTQLLAVTAGATDPAGNAATVATGNLIGYLPSVLFVAETGREGSTVELAVLGDPGRLDGGAINSGFSFGLAVPPALAALLPGAAVAPGIFGEVEVSTIGAGLISPFGVTLAPLALPGPLVNFSASLATEDGVLAIAILGRDSEPSAPFLLIDDLPTGPSLTLIGGSGADTLMAASVDTTIRGRGGDDLIDLGAGGAHTVLFEPTASENGRDTVFGFGTAGVDALPDRIGFAGLDPMTLRGTGRDVEWLGLGDSVGVDTGFIVHTDTLGAGGWLPVLQSLGGLDAGDVFYILGADGEDAELLRIELGTDLDGFADAAVGTIASFIGLADVAGLTEDNILGFSPVP